ncbi:MAG: Serine/threonine kinase, partial [Labilithrix sp.]|nr:Serine/threonine kinase [Labilithrix sp.]
SARAPASGNGRVVAAIVASSVLVASVLAAGGALLIANRRASEAPAASESTPARQSVSTPSLVASGTAATTALTSSTTTGTAAVATTCPDGTALVPGGRFFMGSDDDLPAERPAHKVTLHAYCMDKLEVTAAAYRACSDRGDCKRAGLTNKWPEMTAKDARTYDPQCNGNPELTSRASHPINCVDWNMADRFCKAEGKRLPTEAEWEFAARGSDGRMYPWGDAAPSVKHLNACGAECAAWGKKHGTSLDALFTESDGWATTAPVGSFPLGASHWGVEDMVGNVWEWVADYYASYDDADQEDPTGPPTGTSRAMRGGAWNGAYADWVRPSFRFQSPPDTRSHGVGFRCAKTL